AHETNSGRRYLVAYGDDGEEDGSSEDAAMEASKNEDTVNEDTVIEDSEATVLKATVPERHVYLLGDNRDRSRDSRHFGAIPVGDVVGYVDYIFWPSQSWSRFGVANDRLP
ncbi:MAG: signal peptidase I, partial [Planctomycetota bacterium]